MQEFAENSGLKHRLIEKQAKLTPDADAVQVELEKPLTFSMLNARSNQLARHVQLLRVSIIPVHMHMSIDFIITLLAILKTGVAYVILDPDAAAARKSYIKGRTGRFHLSR